LIGLNHQSIRNVSFSLLPTGYDPEQVDAALNAVAEKLAAGEEFAEIVGGVAFPVTDVGYAPTEVDAFFAKLVTKSDAGAAADPDEVAEAPAVKTAEDDQQLEDPAAVEDTAAEIRTTDQPEAETDLVDDGADAEDHIAYVQAPPDVAWRPPSAGVHDLDVLGQAVDRTADTLGSLRSFIDNEIGAMKLAVERQAQDTVKRCEMLLADASAQATALTDTVNAEISRARKVAERQIEKQRRDLAKELKQAQADCDAGVAQARAAADEYAATVRAQADSDRAEAQRTIENAISMQSSIAESLERARQQLSPSQHPADDLAA
jgi:DivIVA domain-containing protein